MLAFATKAVSWATSVSLPGSLTGSCTGGSSYGNQSSMAVMALAEEDATGEGSVWSCVAIALRLALLNGAARRAGAVVAALDAGAVVSGTPGLDRRYVGGLGRSKNCGMYPCRGMSAFATREASALFALIRREKCTRP